ncbi:hypothetical protein FOZ63_006285 [Perkinsus olseni]|uniref:Uncharacterized protein n=1 Tax=Perkinsus olseni TaxID=32597 RepID=A0A7J6UHI5_PEROL|nr:hypothetical protein FOZ63_006285 [Perkinsus olseni]KAF4756478.1 hypothetical protein FOZ62_017608 [Perkinsus olseni]
MSDQSRFTRWVKRRLIYYMAATFRLELPSELVRLTWDYVPRAHVYRKIGSHTLGRLQPRNRGIAKWSSTSALVYWCEGIGPECVHDCHVVLNARPHFLLEHTFPPEEAPRALISSFRICLPICRVIGDPIGLCTNPPNNEIFVVFSRHYICKFTVGVNGIATLNGMFELGVGDDARGLGESMVYSGSYVYFKGTADHGARLYAIDSALLRDCFSGKFSTRTGEIEVVLADGWDILHFEVQHVNGVELIAILFDIVGDHCIQILKDELKGDEDFLQIPRTVCALARIAKTIDKNLKEFDTYRSHYATHV